MISTISAQQVHEHSQAGIAASPGVGATDAAGAVCAPCPPQTSSWFWAFVGAGITALAAVPTVEYFQRRGTLKTPRSR
jgi:hypothetical protein